MRIYSFREISAIRGFNKSLKSLSLSEFLHPLTTNHAANTDDYEWDAEQLTHIEEHASLECLLNVFGVFDEEAGGEDICKAETEEEACTHLLWAFLVKIPTDEEQQQIGYCLVELTGMARHGIDTLEDERPRHIGYLANDFGVHQIAHADEACRDRRGNGNIVEHAPDAHLCLTYI